MSAHRTAWNLFFQVVPILQAEHYQLTEVGGGQGGTRKGDRDRGDRDRGTGTGGQGQELHTGNTKSQVSASLPSG